MFRSHHFGLHARRKIADFELRLAPVRWGHIWRPETGHVPRCLVAFCEPPQISYYAKRPFEEIFWVGQDCFEPPRISYNAKRSFEEILWVGQACFGATISVPVHDAEWPILRCIWHLLDGITFGGPRRAIPQGVPWPILSHPRYHITQRDLSKRSSGLARHVSEPPFRPPCTTQNGRF